MVLKLFPSFFKLFLINPSGKSMIKHLPQSLLFRREVYYFQSKLNPLLACNTRTLTTKTNIAVIPFKPLVIILMILLNNKGRRTIISLSIAAVSLAFLVSKTYYNAAILPDWLLYTAFFFAIWYNGNFQYFYRFIRFAKQ